MDIFLYYDDKNGKNEKFVKDLWIARGHQAEDMYIKAKNKTEIKLAKEHLDLLGIKELFPKEWSDSGNLYISKYKSNDICCLGSIFDDSNVDIIKEKEDEEMSKMVENVKVHMKDLNKLTNDKPSKGIIQRLKGFFTSQKFIVSVAFIVSFAVLTAVICHLSL
jgi:hypothetical protein